MLLSKNLYLPSKRVKRLLLGASAINYKEDLKKLNITPYFLIENKAFGKLSGHLDLSVMPLGNNVFSSFQNFKIVNKYFKAIEINVSLFNEYPYNCAFNGLALNKYLICNKKCVTPELGYYTCKSALSLRWHYPNQVQSRNVFQHYLSAIPLPLLVVFSCLPNNYISAVYAFQYISNLILLYSLTIHTLWL